jgi:hypothetical protein
MKTISVTDLMLIPELSHLRMLDFINPANDGLIAPYLKILGFDLDYPIEYLPCQHRNMQGKVVIAFLISGEVECNASFLESQWATMEDRIVVNGYRDLGFATDLATALTSSRDYDNGVVEGFPPDLSNPDEDVILMQIKVLADVLLATRGSPFKQDGSRATLAEFGVVEAPEKRRKKASKATPVAC